MDILQYIDFIANYYGLMSTRLYSALQRIDRDIKFSIYLYLSKDIAKDESGGR